MSAPDRSRLGQFLAVLLLAAIAVSVAYRVTDIGFLTLTSIYMFSPMVAAGVVCLANGLAFSEVGLRIGRPRWLVLAALVALPLVALTLLVAVAVPGVAYNPLADPVPGLDLPPGLPGVIGTFGLVLATGATVNTVFAFGEEFGWRGYLLWELAPLGFWPASAIVGALWGLWHSPAIVMGYNFPSFPILGVLTMVLACVAFSPVYTYLVVQAESVITAALFHGVFNGSAGLVLAYAVTEDLVLRELVASPVGFAGILAFGLAAIAIGLTDSPSLAEIYSRG